MYLFPPPTLPGKRIPFARSLISFWLRLPSWRLTRQPASRGSSQQDPACPSGSPFLSRDLPGQEIGCCFDAGGASSASDPCSLLCIWYFLPRVAGDREMSLCLVRTGVCSPTPQGGRLAQEGAVQDTQFATSILWASYGVQRPQSTWGESPHGLSFGPPFRLCCLSPGCASLLPLPSSHTNRQGLATHLRDSPSLPGPFHIQDSTRS